MSLELSKKAAAVKPSSTLAITAKAKELKAQGKDVVGFGAGEPDFNTPENICEAAIKAIKDGFTKYTPASGTNELKAAISKKFKEFNGLDYDTDQIVISNGGKHSLTNIFTALINPGDEVIIPAPFWLSYPEIVKLAGGVPVIVTTTKEQNFKLTAEDLAAAVTDKTKALVLNTPNNPTGMLYTEEELRAIAKVAVEKDFYVVADEMYEMLVYGEQKHISIASLGKDIYDRTITCSGLAKSYAMTGWRIGYTGSSKEIAKMMGSVQSHQTSNPNSIAQKAAVEALTGPQDSVEKMHAEFDKRRKYMYKRICDMDLLDALEPMGAFYVFVDGSAVLGKSYKGTKIESVPQMADILINEYNTAIVPCADFGFPDCFRLSYAISIEQIEKGLDRIESFIKELA
ncbi:pyridoxal phosphate-dependent aminotransferase [Clostridium sp. AM27-31LB]|jgi:aspartate aminotransferase|uniref:pyridoxal phosphate-dependent aminotransferase n=1 Tax=Clostridia TaxID=186801 RepID=UPI000E4E202E|nr:pyridoxal phosphate-dependent aminotransferase [Clostridium sp. AM27-31LB]RHT91140.1 pyridoxal phosphate-dependent aminotransferase [Clostridium sp. AM27-31LB]UYJ40131.1 MAG: pyridoxal phosphate-dependent aminotransferase [Lachnospiraceae bacterium]